MGALYSILSASLMICSTGSVGCSVRICRTIMGELRVGGERALQHLERKLDDLLYGERGLFRQDLPYHHGGAARRVERLTAS